ncbi:MAG: two-component system, sensor histidine kinase YesM [Clostridiales bacterium]|nr:two-component system, sensor histidine kinase YesM [Clostridiales bacterium]
MKILSGPVFHRYYNKLMLFNTVLVCVVALLYGSIASTMAFEYERLNQLSTYEETLSEITTIYNNKQNNFHTLMLTFYDNSEGFSAISNLLEYQSVKLSDLGAFDRQSINTMLRTLASKDSDIRAIIIYKAATDTFYIFNPAANVLQSLSPAVMEQTGFSQTELRRQLLGARDLSKMGALGFDENKSQHAYFLGGNLSTRTSSMIENPGKALVAFDEISLRRALFNKSFGFSGRFLITSLDGSIIFDSWQQYTDANGEARKFIDYAVLADSERSAKIDGKSVYLSAVVDEKRGFVSAYYVPKSEVDSQSMYFSRIILLGSIGFILVSITALLLSTRLMSKRVRDLETGMQQIGSNNLSYRIPLTGGKDEFTAIASRFNYMCDELEQSIKQGYVYQLRQKDAELYALQTSINPHFLYNTLEAIRYNLEYEGHSDSAEMLVLLSKLYRLQTKGAQIIPLRQEFELCESYLELFALRHDKNLAYWLDLPNDLARYAVPKFTIQPILENFLVSGMPRGNEGLVEVSAKLEADGREIVLTVIDNGTGIDPERLALIQKQLAEHEQTSGSGFGLSNVHERIRLVYGDDYGVSIENRVGQPGTVVTIRIQAMTVEEVNSGRFIGEGLDVSGTNS